MRRWPRVADYPTGTVRLALAQEAAPTIDAVRISNAADVLRLVEGPTSQLVHERFVVFLLNARHRVLALLSVADGGVAAVQVDPRTIFAGALLAGASALVLVHNHPSGDPAPSPEDHALTARIVAGADLLGFRVMDHLIIGEHGSFCSMQAIDPCLFNRGRP